MAKPTNSFRRIEVKSVNETPDRFRGILSTYGNIDQVGDICEKGCFDNTLKLKGTKFPLLWQHDWDEPIGSFDVVESENALVIEGSFNTETKRGKEANALLRRGDINGLSIGYYVVQSFFDEKGIQHLTELDLMEGSFVTFPANTQAFAEAKAMRDRQKSKAILEDYLTSLSKSERQKARANLSAYFKELADELAEEEDEEKPKEEETEDEKSKEEPKEEESETGATAEEEDKESEEEDDEEAVEAMKSILEALTIKE